MGNLCCPSNPCSNTVDEKKVLLSPSESKGSTKADGTEEVGFIPTGEDEESSQNEKELTEPDKEVFTDQPNVDNKAANVQSSYTATINSLHTEVSRAAQVSQSSSPGVSEEPVEAVLEITETKKEDGKGESQITAEDLSTSGDTHKAHKEAVLAEAAEEVKALITDNLLVNVDEAAVTRIKDGSKDDETTLEAAKVDTKLCKVEMNVQELDSKVDTENKAKVNVEKEADKINVKKEATKNGMENEAAKIDEENETAKVEVEKLAAGLDLKLEAEVEKKTSKIETKLEDMEMDVKNVIAEVETKKEATEVDVKEVAGVEAEKEAAVEEIETVSTEVNKENVKASVNVSVEKDVSQTMQHALNDSTANEHEEEDLIPPDVAQKMNKPDNSARENGQTESQTPPPVPTSDLVVVEKPLSAEVITEEPVGMLVHKLEEEHEKDIGADLTEVKEDNFLFKTQEHSEKVTCPVVEITHEHTPHNTENGQAEDLKDENSFNMDAALVSEMPQETELPQKTCEESSYIESKAQLPDTSAINNSTIENVDKSEIRHDEEDVEKVLEPIDKNQEAVDFLQNGFDSTTPAENSESTIAQGDFVEVKSIEPTGQRDDFTLGDHIQEVEEPEHQLSKNEKKKEEITSTVQDTVQKEDTESHKFQTGEIILSSSHAVEVALIPVNENEELEDEDLYRGAEEMEEELPKEKQSKPLLEFTIPGVEERCSLAAAVDILAYSEREWKGNTAKSTLIRKGYSEMSCSFTGLRRVRGDNYCALRATLYQALATTTQTPAWLLDEEFTALPEKLEAQEHWISGWTFPSECRKVGEKEDAVEKLKDYMELLQKRWQAAAESESPEEKQAVCERVFQGGAEEYGLLEVLKFLMFARAVELHGKMQAGEEVPVFCWLLFARDTSENPRTFLSNHLSQVGFSGGLEQVEMFLLGYALQHTIQTFRLYKTDTEEFVTHYPDDHKQDWPCVCIVTEDDRHYNVPIRKQAQHQLNHDLSALLPLL
ncbi:uncharacterized protein [Hoplias malabaricus]|uniref:uncharacterized protein n=1 Tax=Hoplias malabaricus TaxID=27720 RepID=UPI003461FF77